MKLNPYQSWLIVFIFLYTSCFTLLSNNYKNIVAPTACLKKLVFNDSGHRPGKQLVPKRKPSTGYYLAGRKFCNKKTKIGKESRAVFPSLLAKCLYLQTPVSTFSLLRVTLIGGLKAFFCFEHSLTIYPSFPKNSLSLSHTQ